MGVNSIVSFSRPPLIQPSIEKEKEREKKLHENILIHYVDEIKCMWIYIYISFRSPFSPFLLLIRTLFSLSLSCRRRVRWHISLCLSSVKQRYTFSHTPTRGNLKWELAYKFIIDGFPLSRKDSRLDDASFKGARVGRRVKRIKKIRRGKLKNMSTRGRWSKNILEKERRERGKNTHISLLLYFLFYAWFIPSAMCIHGLEMADSDSVEFFCSLFSVFSLA